MYRIYCDGACEINPGPMGIGVVVFDDEGTVLEEISTKYDAGTNNQAEYLAIIAALDLCLERSYDAPDVYTDSQLVVNQISGDFKCGDTLLRPLRDRARTLVGQTHARVTWVPRKENDHADRLSKQALRALFSMNDAIRKQIRDLLEANDPRLPSITPSVAAFLHSALSAADRTVCDGLVGLKSGRDTFTALREDDLLTAAEQRHSPFAIARLKEQIKRRSPRTKAIALRWAARGLPPAMVFAKLEIEKAQQERFHPYRRRFA